MDLRFSRRWATLNLIERPQAQCQPGYEEAKTFPGAIQEQAIPSPQVLERDLPPTEQGEREVGLGG